MLSNEERAQISKLWEKLKKEYRPNNQIKKNVYHGKNRIRDLGISIPPQLRNVQESIGWSKIAIDSLADLVIFEGWIDEDGETGLNQVFDDNNLLSEFRAAIIEQFIHGTMYAIVSRGDESIGEPKTLVTFESPDFVAAQYSLRKRRIDFAIQITEFDENKQAYGSLLTADEVIPFILVENEIYDDPDAERTFHGMGRCPVVQFLNKAETGSVRGHSEITEPILSVSMSMMRTLLGAEVAREFYGYPQRYILGAEQDMFMGADGQQKTAMQLSMERIMAVPAPADGKEAHPLEIGQFATNSPEPFIALMRAYSEMFASYADLPQDFLGFSTVNPQSAEARIVSRDRLIRKAQSRIDAAMKPASDLAWLILKVRDGEVPDGFKAVPNFRNPDAASLGAATDSVIKQISQGILRPDSELALRKIGYSRKQIEQIRAENSAITATSLIESLRAANPAAEQQPANLTEALTGADEEA